MNKRLREEYFSETRFNRYLLSVGNDLSKAKQLYLANIRLAQAFHPLVTQFEVVLRNSLNHHLAIHFGDKDWIINQDIGFMSHSSLNNSRYFLKRSVIKSKRSLKKRSVPITSGKVISSLTFGFWIALYLRHHYRLIGGAPLNVFIQKPSYENRASIYAKLDLLRNFRNRVNPVNLFA